MDRNNVDKAVIIQFLGNYDNSYELECVRNYPDRLAAVVMVDTDKEDAPDNLEKLAHQGAVGVRLRPDCVSPSADPVTIWRKASELGMVVSSIGRVEQFATEYFRKLVEKLLDLKIVLEHLGGLGLERGMMGIGHNQPMDYNLFRKVLALAECH